MSSNIKHLEKSRDEKAYCFTKDKQYLGRLSKETRSLIALGLLFSCCRALLQVAFPIQIERGFILVGAGVYIATEDSMVL